MATRNERLTTMLNWARQHNINLDCADIMCKWNTISFNHRSETAANMRAVKRAIGEFKADPGYGDVDLIAEVEFGGLKIKVKYLGAMECTITRDCRPAKFEDGSDPLVEA